MQRLRNSLRLNIKRLSNERFLFVKSLLKSPGEIGQVLPSSRFLSEKMVANLDLKKAKVVVEFGPGTGSVTKEIMSRLGSQTKFFAFETNENMVSILRRRFPTINVIHDSAENIDIHMKKRGIEQVDYIISSLPFTLFSPDLRIKIIEKSYTSLRPGGEFVAYQYLHAAFLAESVGKINTKTGFKSVVSSMALLNVPPAFVFRCKK